MRVWWIFRLTIIVLIFQLDNLCYRAYVISMFEKKLIYNYQRETDICHIFRSDILARLSFLPQFIFSCLISNVRCLTINFFKKFNDFVASSINFRFVPNTVLRCHFAYLLLLKQMGVSGSLIGKRRIPDRTIVRTRK